MLLATPCGCAEPREFEENWCHRCGRMLQVVLGEGVSMGGWPALDMAIDRTAEKLRSQAEDEGVDVADDEAYGRWLKARMARHAREN